MRRFALRAATVTLLLLHLADPRAQQLLPEESPSGGTFARAVDPLLTNQWHLKARSLEVGGANVTAEWPTTKGSGVTIAIVDDGLQWTHPDLEPNYVGSASYDFNFNDPDPSPDPAQNYHGTAVAGVAAARDDNGIGGAGAAPRASIAGIRLIAAGVTDQQEADALGYLPASIDISSNSWGPSDDGRTLAGPGPLTYAAIQAAVTNGRGGRGRVFLWAAGNGGSGDNCNFDGYANNRFAMAVGALDDTGDRAFFSESCAALLVTAPSNGGSRGITTTDLVGSSGYSSSDYTSTFGGTSSATPLVAGAVALMLARNPNLTWRDVQSILRRSSHRLQSSDAGWTAGPYPHNEKYGFGQLDAAAAADMAAGWTNVPAETVLSPATRTVNLTVPDNNTAGVSDGITISNAESDFVVEHVEVNFTATHTWRGDLQVTLTSPAGVVSTLAPTRSGDSNNNFSDWRFGSVRHWGESSVGTWTLRVADQAALDVGTWNSWTLRIYGYRDPVPAQTDTDSDGLSDAFETRFGLDPNSGSGNYGASGDPDGDGFTNLQEYERGSNPVRAQVWPHVLDLNSDRGGDALLYDLSTGAWRFEVTNRLSTGFTERLSAWDPGWQVYPANLNADEYTDFFLYDPVRGLWVQALKVSGGGTFTYTVGNWDRSWTVVPADLDGDGLTDMFVYNFNTGVWVKCFVNGSGDFKGYTVGNWDPGWTFFTADLNGDGRDDFFLYNRVNGVWVEAFSQGGFGAFDYPVVSRWDPGWQVYPTDLNGDGRTDLFLLNAAGVHVSALSRATADFDYVGGPRWAPGWSVSSGDLNADGFSDLFLYNPTTGLWVEAFSDGAGGFTYTAAQQWDPGWSVAMTDFNEDGRGDLLVSRADGTWVQATNTGLGTFTYAVGNWGTGWSVYARRFGDR